MATNGKHSGPSEYDGAPGRARSNRDRTLKEQRKTTRRSGDPEPPIAGVYTGWDTYRAPREPVVSERQRTKQKKHDPFENNDAPTYGDLY